MRPQSPTIDIRPPAAALPLVHVTVTVTCALRAGQELPDVHVATGRARTYLAALTAATDAAVGKVPAGVRFRLSSTVRR